MNIELTPLQAVHAVLVYYQWMLIFSLIVLAARKRMRQRS